MTRNIVVFLLFLLAGCAPSIRVYTDRDPDFDLSNYSTYIWSQSPDIDSERNPLLHNDLNDKRIKSAVDKQLAMRGYTLVNEIPQLTLHFHIIIEDASAIVTDPYSAYWIQIQTHVYQYTEGTLILDIMDNESGGLIWRGWAVSAIEDTYTSEEMDRLINTAVEKIFKKFPQK